jgi:RNA polymerase sigma factor (sigma-70 family)
LTIRTGPPLEPPRVVSGVQNPVRASRHSRVPDRAESDERLVARVRTGDEVAFATIAERYSPLLLSLSRHIVGDDAQDAVQHALTSAWGALRRGDDVRELRPWLCTIARRAALQTLRARGDGAVELPASLAGGPSPAEHLERSDRTYSILAAIAQLPAAEQSALVSTSVHGRSGRDTATALGVSENTVRQLVYRARTRVRAAVHVFLPPVSVMRVLAKWSHGARRIAAPVNGASGLASSSEAVGLAVKVGAVLVVGVAVGAPVITLSRSDQRHDGSRPFAHGERVKSSVATRTSRRQRVPSTPVLVPNHSALAPRSSAGTAPRTTAPANPDGSASVTGVAGPVGSSARAEPTRSPAPTTAGVAPGQEPKEAPPPPRRLPEAAAQSTPVVRQILPTVSQTVQGVGPTAQGTVPKTGEALGQVAREVTSQTSTGPQGVHPIALPANPVTAVSTIR